MQNRKIVKMVSWAVLSIVLMAGKSAASSEQDMLAFVNRYDVPLDAVHYDGRIALCYGDLVQLTDSPNAENTDKRFVKINWHSARTGKNEVVSGLIESANLVEARQLSRVKQGWTLKNYEYYEWLGDSTYNTKILFTAAGDAQVRMEESYGSEQGTEKESPVVKQGKLYTAANIAVIKCDGANGICAAFQYDPEKRVLKKQIVPTSDSNEWGYSWTTFDNRKYSEATGSEYFRHEQCKEASEGRAFCIGTICSQ